MSLHRSERHFALDVTYPTEVNMLPLYRQAVNGRTYDRSYSPAEYGSALEKPAPKHRIKDIVFGICMAGVVGAILYEIAMGVVEVKELDIEGMERAERFRSFDDQLTDAYAEGRADQAEEDRTDMHFWRFMFAATLLIAMLGLGWVFT